MTLKLYWPTEFMNINQEFGTNRYMDYTRFGLPGHEGLDIQAPHGSKVFSCADGVVRVVNAPGVPGYLSSAYGTHIRLEHIVEEDGKPVVYETIYAHLQQALVNVGDTVKASHTIGIADSTGNSTGSHLHLTLKRRGATAAKQTNFPSDIIDPTPYIVREYAPANGEPEPESETWGCTAVVLAENSLNVRSKPAKDGAILGRLTFNTRITATHEYTNPAGEKWVKVTYGDKDAWVSNAWVRLENCTGDLPAWGTSELPPQIPAPAPTEPTPTHPPAEPAPTPNDALIAEIMPVFKLLVVDSVVMGEHVSDALAILTKYGLQD